MPGIPFYLFFLRHQWEDIEKKLNAQAMNSGIPTYSANPQAYEIGDWKIAKGLRLSCKARWINQSYEHDFGRVVA